MSISLQDIVLTRGSQTLVNGFSTVCGDSDRIAIFGPNGAGKSSLMQAIVGDLPLESGSIGVTPTGASVGFLEQLRTVPVGWTVREVLRQRTGVAKADADLQSASARLGTDFSPGAVADYERALARFSASGADTLDGRAPAVLADIGLGVELDRSCEGLSGGELARLALAGVLLSHFDALLLDEPTNDLDENGLRLLTEFVMTRSVPVLFVSHDRRFLEAVTTGVIEFDPRLDQVTRFEGGYEAWRRERARAHETAVEENVKYTETVSELKAQADAIRRRSARGVRTANRAYEQGSVDKLLRDRMLDGATAGASSARRTQRRLEKLEKPAEVRKVWNLQLAFPQSSNPAAAFVLDSVGVAAGDFEVGPVSLTINPGERLRIHGRNGSGKSLILAVLAGRTLPSTGRLSGADLRHVGVLDQQRSVVPLGFTSLAEWFPRVSELSVSEARTQLAKFGLGGDDVERPMETLSPGERTRVGLALLATRRTTGLILDEPTNHLDVPAIEQLEQALSIYRGTLIITTHDEEFANGLSVERTLDLDDVSG